MITEKMAYTIYENKCKKLFRTERVERCEKKLFCIMEARISLKYGYRNPTGFRRWVKVAKSGGLCYTCVMGTWKSKTDTSICYSTILFSYASIERNC